MTLITFLRPECGYQDCRNVLELELIEVFLWLGTSRGDRLQVDDALHFGLSVSRFPVKSMVEA